MSLSCRQLEVVSLIGQGRTWERAAYELGISVETTKTYARRAVRRCGDPSWPGGLQYQTIRLAFLLEAVTPE